MYWNRRYARSTPGVERVFRRDSAGKHMVSRKSGEPSPESIARADRQRIAAEEGKQAMAEIARQAIAVRENMARLRALREAGEMNAEAVQPPADASKPKRKKRAST
jgi:hypothetical protein